jgi:hypothetical protein
MTVILITAVVAGGGVECHKLVRRALLFRSKAADNARLDAAYRVRAGLEDQHAQGLKEMVSKREMPIEYVGASINIAESDARDYRKRAEYHRALKRKYGQAASWPWESIQPDPPAPLVMDDFLRAVHTPARAESH